MTRTNLLVVMTLSVLYGSCTQTDIRNTSVTGSTDGSILPFPEPPSASTYGETIFESQHVSREHGRQAAVCNVGRTVPAAFSATETFDVGVGMSSPVSLKYHEFAPFAFNGKINRIKVNLL